ncbi:MAG: exodeoxyribonuclease VII small subunit [candidate division Zixibacteria bacterium]|nr:exodeoxyribonuclease VII small subunit [candidate division Zixibacteria bacterium]
MPSKKLNFEKLLRRLEEIAEQLESGDLGLEESLKIFREGVELSRQCTKFLDESETELKRLVRLDGKKFKLEPLNQDE